MGEGTGEEIIRREDGDGKVRLGECQADQTLLGRTFFGRVRPGSFFVFINGFVGEVEIEDQLGVGELDVIHKGINQAAAVSLGALRGGDSELLQQEQDLITGEGEGLFCIEGRKLIGKCALLLLQIGKAGREGGAGGAVLNGREDVLDLVPDIGQGFFQCLLLRVRACGLSLLQLHDGIRNLLQQRGLQQQIGDGVDHHSLQLVLRDIFAGAGAADGAAGAGVVVVHLAVAAAAAADALHQAAALSTVQFAGEDIIGAGGVRGAALAVAFKHFLCPFP